MSRLAVLINPAAGAGRGARVGTAVLALLRRRGHDVRVLPAGTARDGGARPDLADVDALVVVGGDGTVHAALGLTAGTGLPLGVVPAGTGDDVAATLGLPRRDVAGAVRALEAALARGPRLVDAVRAGPPGDAAGTWFVGVLSCGFDAAVSARASAMRGGGRTRYLRAVGAELRGFAPYGYRLTTDDAVRGTAGTLVAAANAPRFGGGIRIAPDARVDDGLLDVVVAGTVSRRGLVALLPGAYRGRHLRHPAVEVLRTRSLLVEADPRWGGPPPLAFADGEPLGPLPLRATVVPGALAVLA